jgi:uncharacterized protein (TIGR02246 family)
MSPLGARLQAVEERLQHLDNLGTVRRVMAEYCRAIDTGDIKTVEALFSRDAEVTVVPWGLECKGRDAIVEFYRQFFQSEMKNGRHNLANEIIERDGDGYRSFCYFHETVERDGDSLVGWGTYEHTFLHEDGAWKICKKRVTIMVLASIHKGWAGPEKIATL